MSDTPNTPSASFRVLDELKRCDVTKNDSTLEQYEILDQRVQNGEKLSDTDQSFYDAVTRIFVQKQEVMQGILSQRNDVCSEIIEEIRQANNIYQTALVEKRKIDATNTITDAL